MTIKRLYLTLMISVVSVAVFAQTSIIIPPRKDDSGITQVYQKKRQQVVAMQKSRPQSIIPSVSKIQGICISQIVDLGLSVKWAGWNLGASSTEQKGGYYGWGDQHGVNRSKDVNYYPSSTPPASISGTQYDVARYLWGNKWRMPNAYEILELYNECKWEWVIFKGIYGAKVTGPNGNAIFLPAAGSREGDDYDAINEECNYWSGSLDPTCPVGAFCVSVEINGNRIEREFYNEERCLGLSIRPVYDSNMPLVDLSPEEFQQRGLANVARTIATYKISAISSCENGNWSNWDNTFNGVLKVNEFTEDNQRTIFIYQNGTPQAILILLVNYWGISESDGNGGTIINVRCKTLDNPEEIMCTFHTASNGVTQFVCPFNGITWSFYLSE